MTLLPVNRKKNILNYNIKTSTAVVFEVLNVFFPSYFEQSVVRVHRRRTTRTRTFGAAADVTLAMCIFYFSS